MMSDPGADDLDPWSSAVLAATLFGIDPIGLGGVSVKAGAGPVREAWLDYVIDCLPAATPVRKIPNHVSDDRLLGGLDLAATLRSGRPIADQGLLVEADGGIVVLAMAERLSASKAARIVSVLDSGEVVRERDGLAARTPARFGVVALDEGIDRDENPPPALLDRLAFHVDLTSVSYREALGSFYDGDQIIGARRTLERMDRTDTGLDTLCTTALALGIRSIRAPLLALRTARTLAALNERSTVSDTDITTAARLVFAPRAEVFPVEETPEEDTAPEEPEKDTDDDQPDTDDSAHTDPLEDMILEAVKTAIPEDLLSQLISGTGPRAQSRGQGRAGQLQQSQRRGRPAGVRRGDPSAGKRLNVVETLRAAAPWQPIRRANTTSQNQTKRVEVRPDDFRITRFKHRTETLTIFAVDASGSSALHRLAEAKGAVEILLADAYVRRDEVALIAFRGTGAELILPPTRSLTRAKRCLAGLPGGGGTPLAAGIDAALELALAVRRRGQTPSLVFLTDGQPNIARDGSPGRTQAGDDALAACRAVRAEGFAAAVIDTSPRRHPFAERLATEMGAQFVPLPNADAATVSQAIQETIVPAANPV